jgi:tetratricopeptide (TPR) repeat protein
MSNEKMLQGDTLFEEGKTKDALDCYFDVLFKSEPNAEVFMKIGHCNKVMGDDENALEYYQKSLDLDPENLECLFNAGESHINLNHQEEGIELMEKVIELAAKTGGNIGKIALQKKQLAQGVLKNRLGGALLKEGDLEGAHEAFLEAIELYPQDQRNYANIGVIYLKQGDTEQGIEWFTKAIEVNPDYVRGYFNLGTLMIQMGRYQQAANLFSKALEIEPDGRDSEDLRTNLGVAEENKAAYMEELISILSGSQISMNQERITELINGIVEETITSADIVFLDNGKMKCIAYGANKNYEVLFNDASQSVIMNKI